MRSTEEILALAAEAAVEASKIGARAIEMAVEARSEIREHIKLDEVLHAQLLKNQDEAKAERSVMHVANQGSIRRIYDLLWKVALALIIGMAGVIYTSLKNGGH